LRTCKTNSIQKFLFFKSGRKKGKEGKRREEGKEGKGREGKGREGKGREGREGKGKASCCGPCFSFGAEGQHRSCWQSGSHQGFL